MSLILSKASTPSWGEGTHFFGRLRRTSVRKQKAAAILYCVESVGSGFEFEQGRMQAGGGMCVKERMMQADGRMVAPHFSEQVS